MNIHLPHQYELTRSNSTLALINLFVLTVDTQVDLHHG
jgi:hypothetical protein